MIGSYRTCLLIRRTLVLIWRTVHRSLLLLRRMIRSHGTGLLLLIRRTVI